MSKVAIIYMAHDGFSSLYTGVGTVARDFLLSFPQVRQQLSHEFPQCQLDLFVSTIKYTPECLGYSDKHKETTLAFIAEHPRLHFVELLNSSKGDQSYGTIGHWQAASISGATLIGFLMGHYDRIIALAVDTPFALVGIRFFNQFQASNVEIIWIPQSTAKIHNFGDSLETLDAGDKESGERFEFEKRAVDATKKNAKLKVAYVGEFMRKHLMNEYNAISEGLVSLRNGLYFPRLRANRLDQLFIAGLLKKLGVPLDRPLLFSFGRAEPYKGLDLVLKNASYLVREKKFFILIICSPNRRYHPYIAELDFLAREFPNDSKIIFDLDFKTPHYVMQWENTKILAVLSRAEPFGLIPIESRFYHNDNMALLVSNIGGLADQVDDGRDGFITDLNDKTIQSRFSQLANFDDSERKNIVKNGYAKIIEEYDQVRINTQFLRRIIADDKNFV